MGEKLCVCSEVKTARVIMQAESIGASRCTLCGMTATAFPLDRCRPSQARFKRYVL
jgi:hypothetical protein